MISIIPEIRRILDEGKPSYDTLIRDRYCWIAATLLFDVVSVSWCIACEVAVYWCLLSIPWRGEGTAELTD